MTRIALRDYNRAVVNALKPPSRAYWGAALLLLAGIGWGAILWGYQIVAGMGVAGINSPIGWGTYIANFVFWVGIGHAGTLISAVLFLLGARWRNAIHRSAEAMTIFAIATAGLFPLIHLGRTWVFWFMLPYPNQRQLWPDYKSPLVWDVMAVGTYFIISLVFWYAGLIPDLAAVRDASTGWRRRFYRLLAVGWTGSDNQWRHYLRGYMVIAALATPLVFSVHSVVSWDFAMALLPGWHSTMFAPYFLSSAIYSGLGMVILLLIGMRHFLDLRHIIRIEHLEQAALLLIPLGSLVGYFYAADAFMSWYSNDIYQRQFSRWQMLHGFAWAFWPMVACNFGAPLLFFFKKVRTNLVALAVIAALVVFGVWLDHLAVTLSATAHDFMPENWAVYRPTWVEVSIGFASVCWFLLGFLLFVKLLPPVPIAEQKNLPLAAVAEAE
jgi:Ni/Fe-hydrogenase subunit HybB-like protein